MMNGNYYNGNMNTYNNPCTCNNNGNLNYYNGGPMKMSNNGSISSPNISYNQNGSLSTPSIQHGLVERPLSRAAKCVNYKTEVDYAYALQQCGEVINNSGGLEAPKGFPQGGPPDGQIASAGQWFARELDEQSAERWWKNDLGTGEQPFTWVFHAPHPTTKFEYFITKKHWNPNQPLTRESFDLSKPLATVPYNGETPQGPVSHTVPIPEDYCGYHIILAVWTIADTDNAFYNVIDLCLHPRNGAYSNNGNMNNVTYKNNGNFTGSHAHESYSPMNVTTNNDICQSVQFTQSSDSIDIRIPPYKKADVSIRYQSGRTEDYYFDECSPFERTVRIQLKEPVATVVMGEGSCNREMNGNINNDIYNDHGNFSGNMNNDTYNDHGSFNGSTYNYYRNFSENHSHEAL